MDESLGMRLVLLLLQIFKVKPTAQMGGCVNNYALKSSSERRWSLLAVAKLIN